MSVQGSSAGHGRSSSFPSDDLSRGLRCQLILIHHLRHRRALVSIAVTPVSPSIAPGTTRQFTATGTYANGAISPSPHRRPGSLRTRRSPISAISRDRRDWRQPRRQPARRPLPRRTTALSGSTSLTVSPVSSIAVTPANPLSIAPGTTVQFAATGTLADSAVQTLTAFATWTSSSIAIATVSDVAGSKGLATATIPGTGSATITATYTGVSGTATLTSSSLLSIGVTPTAPSIAKGTTQQFTATGTLADANTQTLTTFATWSTSSAGVATISNAAGSKGRATAVNVGAATITSLFTGSYFKSGDAHRNCLPY